jgi:large subunit ribosomal protein L22
MKKNTKKNKETVKVDTTPVVSNRIAVAKLKHLRIGPRKLRLVVDAVRFQPVGKAFQTLMVLKKKGARIVEKILNTAAANAKVIGMDESRLYIADIRVDGGPVMKRFMARSMGRADRILKRTSHLSMILKEGGRQWKDSSVELPEVVAEVKTGKIKRSSRAQAKAGGKKKAAAGAV